MKVPFMVRQSSERHDWPEGSSRHTPMQGIGWIVLIMLLLLAATTATLARSSHSALPHGLTDYLGLSTAAVPPGNSSSVQTKLKNTPGPAMPAAPPSNFS